MFRNPLKVFEKNLNEIEINKILETKPLRFDDVKDPEAYAFFKERKYINKNIAIYNKINPIKGEINKANNTHYKFGLDSKIINNNPNIIKRNLTPSKNNLGNLNSGREKILKSFCEEKKSRKIASNTDDRITPEKPMIYFHNHKESKNDEFNYENIDTSQEDKFGNGEGDENEKILNTIKLISKNKKNFTETNKILKDIGNFYREKKNILSNYVQPGINEIKTNIKDHIMEDKLNLYQEEHNKVENEINYINEKIDYIKTKSGSLNKVSQEFKKSQNKLNNNCKNNFIIFFTKNFF